MIDNKIEELFETIESSREYQAYKEIEDILKKDKSINELIEEIKALQQLAVKLEENDNPEYKDVDKKIEQKVELLNSKPVYQEYLRRMNEFNDILSMSSKMVEDYIEDKVD